MLNLYVLRITPAIPAYTAQPKNNARARSGARRSCAARTRKRSKEVKLRFIRKKFQTQELQNPIRKKPQEVTDLTANRKPQIAARSYSSVLARMPARVKLPDSLLYVYATS